MGAMGAMGLWGSGPGEAWRNEWQILKMDSDEDGDVPRSVYRKGDSEGNYMGNEWKVIHGN